MRLFALLTVGLFSTSLGATPFDKDKCDMYGKQLALAKAQFGVATESVQEKLKQEIVPRMAASPDGKIKINFDPKTINVLGNMALAVAGFGALDEMCKDPESIKSLQKMKLSQSQTLTPEQKLKMWEEVPIEEGIGAR